MPTTRRTLMAKSLMPRPQKAARRARYEPSAPPRADSRQRYWPVFETVSIDLPASVPLLPEMSVRM
jgi:hypothetical protein